MADRQDKDIQVAHFKVVDFLVSFTIGVLRFSLSAVAVADEEIYFGRGQGRTKTIREIECGGQAIQQ